jgi:hypothetical protein
MVIRNLSKAETDEIKDQLDKKLLTTFEEWHPYWYPLYPVKPNIHAIAFRSDYIAIKENIEKIREIFINNNIFTAIEVREIGNARIIDGFTDKDYFLVEDEDSVILPYMSECFWFDSSESWLMYTSHEGTIAFEGEWLVNEISEQLSSGVIYSL